MKKVINNIEYEVVENVKDCFDQQEVQEKLNDVDYFNDFDYILGDYAYDKLRLKGFYAKNNKKVNDINNYDKIKDYIDNYRSYGCRYFILKKVSK